jgi:hypothetical protein
MDYTVGIWGAQKVHAVVQEEEDYQHLVATRQQGLRGQERDALYLDRVLVLVLDHDLDQEEQDFVLGQQ